MAQPLRVLLAFFGLVFVQVLIGTVYALSQSHHHYSFYPETALALAEFFKLLMAALPWLQQLSKQQEVNGLSIPALLHFAKEDFFRNVTSDFAWGVIALSFGYCVNNNLTFSLFQVADPATIQLFKCGTTVTSAVLMQIFLKRKLSFMLWCMIIQQIVGLIGTQIDGCSELPVLPGLVYSFLFLSSLLSAASAVWNEYQLKAYDVETPKQLMVMYSSGCFMNLLLFFAYRQTFSFFKGYTWGAIGIVFCNSVVGLVVVNIYKVADVLVKTFASAVSTAILMLLSIFLFRSASMTLHRVLGTVTVFVATYLFLSNRPASESKPEPPSGVPKTSWKSIIIAIVVSVSVVALLFVMNIQPPSGNSVFERILVLEEVSKKHSTPGNGHFLHEEKDASAKRGGAGHSDAVTLGKKSDPKVKMRSKELGKHDKKAEKATKIAAKQQDRLGKIEHPERQMASADATKAKEQLAAEGSTAPVRSEDRESLKSKEQEKMKFMEEKVHTLEQKVQQLS